MEGRQLLTGTFSLGAFIPASVTYADQAAKMWTPSKQTGGYTLHQSTTTTGPDGSTSTQVVDQDVTSTNSVSGDWDEHFTGTTTLTTHSTTTNSDGTTTTSDVILTSTVDEHRWGTTIYGTSMPGMPPMPMPSPWNYHSSQTYTVSSLIETVGNGANDETITNTTQTTTQDGTVSASGQDDGVMVFHADGTIDSPYTNSVTDADTGDVQSETLTDHQHYVFDDTAGRGSNTTTPNMTASGDGSVRDVLTETWGTLSTGSDGYSQTVTSGSDYHFTDSNCAGTETWSITQNADQGQTTQTSVSYVTDDGLTVNATLNASETDTAGVTSNSDGTGTVQVGETDSLAVHADITSADGGSTSFDASVGQTLGTNDIPAVGLGGPIGAGVQAGLYIRSMKRPGQPDLPMRVIGPNLTPTDIRNTYWNYLATKWNGGLYAWPFSGTPGKLGAGSGLITDKLDPRPVAQAPTGIPYDNGRFRGIVLQPWWDEFPEADGKLHLHVDVKGFYYGVCNFEAIYDTGITRD